MKRSIYILISTIVSLAVISSCKKDDDDPAKPVNVHENEIITTMRLVITEEGNAANSFSFQFHDIDGTGPEKPAIDTIRLMNGASYHVQILLLNENTNPVDTISHEVEEEGDEHQFFFSVKGASLTIAPADSDSHGVPVGLETYWSAGDATTGKEATVQITLMHQGEDKPDTPPGNPDIGESDIQVAFPVLIR